MLDANDSLLIELSFLIEEAALAALALLPRTPAPSIIWPINLIRKCITAGYELVCSHLFDFLNVTELFDVLLLDYITCRY